MESNREIIAPPEYDQARVDKFMRRATDKRNLPPQFKPDKDLPHALFVDGIISLYIAESEANAGSALEAPHLNGNARKYEEHQRNLARVALLVDYLSGAEPRELQDGGEDQARIRKEGVLPYVLEVASKGARSASDLRIVEKIIDEPHNPAAVIQELPAMEILKSHSDLDDVIKRLYHDHRMSSAQAQSLLLLFELQQSQAEPEVRAAALTRARKELDRKLKGAMMDETRFRNGEFIDPRVRVGAQYVRMVAGTPMHKSNGMKLGGVVDAVMVKNDDFSSRQDAELHVRSYIGRTLDTLYPRQ